MTPLGQLAGALELGASECVSVVGGGGKTTVTHGLAAQLVGRRVVTSTTKMGHDQHGGFEVLFDPTDAELVAATAAGPVVAWCRLDGEKAIGVRPERCDHWLTVVDHVVIEADGSRRRPFKSPASYEPVVPASTTMLVSVIGAGALGQQIDTVCHRPELVASRAGVTPHDVLTPTRAASVLCHPDGSERTRPASARSAVVINAVRPEQHDMATELAELVRSAFDHVVLLPAFEA